VFSVQDAVPASESLENVYSTCAWLGSPGLRATRQVTQEWVLARSRSSGESGPVRGVEGGPEVSRKTVVLDTERLLLRLLEEFG